MNFFEKLVLGLLRTLPSTIPIFVHSQHGVVIANATENILTNVIGQFQPTEDPATK